MDKSIQKNSILENCIKTSRSSPAFQPKGHPDVFVRLVMPQEAVIDAFRPLIRDGAALVEVQIHLQKALKSLRDVAPDTFAQAATDMAKDALPRADSAELAPCHLVDVHASDLLARTPSEARLDAQG